MKLQHEMPHFLPDPRWKVAQTSKQLLDLSEILEVIALDDCNLHQELQVEMDSLCWTLEFELQMLAQTTFLLL